MGGLWSNPFKDCRVSEVWFIGRILQLCSVMYFFKSDSIKGKLDFQTIGTFDTSFTVVSSFHHASSTFYHQASGIFPSPSQVTSILKYLFPVPKEESKRVITFANQDDYISFRYEYLVWILSEAEEKWLWEWSQENANFTGARFTPCWCQLWGLIHGQYSRC